MAASERGEKERGPVRDKPNSDPNSPITDEGGSWCFGSFCRSEVDRRKSSTTRQRTPLWLQRSSHGSPAIRLNLQRSGQISTNPVKYPAIRSRLHRSGHISTDPVTATGERSRTEKEKRKREKSRIEEKIIKK